MELVGEEDDNVSYTMPATRMDTPFHVRTDTRRVEESVQRTPDMAVQNFDGGFDVVRARSVQTRKCSRPLFNFAVSAAIVSLSLITCLILLAVNGFDAPGSEWLKTIAAFLLGVFLPNPQIKSNKNNANAPGSDYV